MILLCLLSREVCNYIVEPLLPRGIIVLSINLYCPLIEVTLCGGKACTKSLMTDSLVDIQVVKGPYPVPFSDPFQIHGL